MAMAMRSEEAAAVLPEPGPDPLPVSLRNLQPRQGFAREELETPLAMGGRQDLQSPLHLEQEHQPMALSLIAVLARQASQVQVGRRQHHAELLLSLAAATRVRGFARVGVQLAAAGAP